MLLPLGCKKPTDAKCRLLCGYRSRDGNNYQKKKIIFSLTVEGS